MIRDIAKATSYDGFEGDNQIRTLASQLSLGRNWHYFLIYESRVVPMATNRGESD